MQIIIISEMIQILLIFAQGISLSWKENLKKYVFQIICNIGVMALCIVENLLIDDKVLCIAIIILAVLTGMSIKKSFDKIAFLKANVKYKNVANLPR